MATCTHGPTHNGHNAITIACWPSASAAKNRYTVQYFHFILKCCYGPANVTLSIVKTIVGWPNQICASTMMQCPNKYGLFYLKVCHKAQNLASKKTMHKSYPFSNFLFSYTLLYNSKCSQV